MRTTLNIDRDVLLAVKERARREGRSVGAVISELARAALTSQGRRSDDEAEAVHGFEPLPQRGPAVSNELIDQLREDDE